MEASGATVCTLCPKGAIADSKGLDTCTKCAGGHYQPEAAMAACLRCQIGAFQLPPPKGRTAVDQRDTTKCLQCKDLGEGRTTQGVGNSLPTDCLCPVGSVQVNKDCKTCKEGMLCAEFGMTVPKLAPSYYVHNVTNTLDVFAQSVYLCEPPEACLGGNWSQKNCVPPRTGFLCTECPFGTVSVSVERCE